MVALALLSILLATATPATPSLRQSTSGCSVSSNIQQDVLNIWTQFSGSDPSDPTIAQQLNQNWKLSALRTQSFVNRGASGSFCVFNFTNSNAAFSEQNIKDVPSPDGAANIDWQQLQKVSGDLANTVYRLNTVQGTNADSGSDCNPSYPLNSAKYTAKFVFI
ncbi:hypothetical protein DFH94DRAFT_195409 [Russula ochroleuca]|uniref:Secreted protein n=1 Tax=Russula ochroleuca TaxID=152965 RepID=A0A9P5JZ87_9AGAM|nr:hypothetical protein DFH94DRAFT_195409 [Russula ochroleuca]